MGFRTYRHGQPEDVRLRQLVGGRWPKGSERRSAIHHTVGRPAGRGCVLEVCDYHGSYGGGFCPSLLAVGRLTRAQLGLSYHVVVPEQVADRAWVGELAAAGFGVSTIAPGTGILSATKELIDLGRRLDVRIMRSHFTRWDIPVAIAARFLGARSVWHVHSERTSVGVKTCLKDLFKIRLVGRSCDRVVAVSDEVARITADRGLSRSKVTTILNGLDVQRDGVQQHTRRQARAELSLSAHDLIVLGFGWAPYLKGVDLMLLSVEQLAETLSILLLLVGQVPMQRFIDSQLGHRPSWLKVAPPADDPTVLFKASDVFVSASRAEAFSFAIGDAMVAERPVVASNLRGPSAFYGGGGVFLFESGDANDLTRALRQVLTADATTRTRWGRDNRRYVSDHLNLEDHAQNVTDTYSRLLARPRNGVLAARHGASRLDV